MKMIKVIDHPVLAACSWIVVFAVGIAVGTSASKQKAVKASDVPPGHSIEYYTEYTSSYRCLSDTDLYISLGYSYSTTEDAQEHVDYIVSLKKKGCSVYTKSKDMQRLLHDGTRHDPDKIRYRSGK